MILQAVDLQREKSAGSVAVQAEDTEEVKKAEGETPKKSCELRRDTVGGTPPGGGTVDVIEWCCGYGKEDKEGQELTRKMA